MVSFSYVMIHDKETSYIWFTEVFLKPSCVVGLLSHEIKHFNQFQLI